MPRITDFIIVETPSQHVLVIEKTVNELEMVQFFVDSIFKLGTYIREHDCIPADIPFMQVVDAKCGAIKVCVGNAVPKEIQGYNEIRNRTMPSGKKVICYYQGSNAEMDSFYKEFDEYISNNGYKKLSSYFEFFLNGPEYGTDKLLTKVMCVIEDK